MLREENILDNGNNKTEYFFDWLKKWSYYDNLLLMPIFFLFYDFLLRSYTLERIGVQAWDEIALIVFIVIIFNEIDFKNKTWWMIPIGVFFLIGIMDIVGSGFNGRSTIDGYRLIYQPLLWGAYFIVIFKNSEIFQKAKMLMVGIGTFLAVHGIFQMLFKVPMLDNWIDTTDVIQHRAFSILGSPNSLGSFMVMHIGMMLGLILIEKSRKKQILYVGLTIIALLALYFTYSRGAILAIVVSIAFVLMVFNKRLLLYFTFFSTGLLLLVDQGAYRFYNLLTPDSISNMLTDGRLAKWSEAIKYGISNFYADNFYLKTLVENGIFGTIAFIIFMGYFLYKLLKNRKNYFIVGIVITILGFLLHNFVDNLYSIPTLAFYFYVYLAMGVSQIKNDSGDEIL